MTGREAVATVLVPPGRYGDGPVWIRVHKARAGAWRLPSDDYEIERNDRRCSWDPTYDYVEIENTHSAFLYVYQMIKQGVTAGALAVVRLADVRTVL